ncbi:hypothetical protein MHYP_G00319870 [Metynnis hypsauchen]
MNMSVISLEMTERHDATPSNSTQAAGSVSALQAAFPQGCPGPLEAQRDMPSPEIVGNVGGFMVGSGSELGSAGGLGHLHSVGHDVIFPTSPVTTDVVKADEIWWEGVRWRKSRGTLMGGII